MSEEREGGYDPDPAITTDWTMEEVGETDQITADWTVVDGDGDLPSATELEAAGDVRTRVLEVFAVMPEVVAAGLTKLGSLTDPDRAGELVLRDTLGELSVGQKLFPLMDAMDDYNALKELDDLTSTGVLEAFFSCFEGGNVDTNLAVFERAQPSKGSVSQLKKSGLIREMLRDHLGEFLVRQKRKEPEKVMNKAWQESEQSKQVDIPAYMFAIKSNLQRFSRFIDFLIRGVRDKNWIEQKAGHALGRIELALSGTEEDYAVKEGQIM